MFSWYYIEGILIQSCYTLLIVLGLSILTGYTGMFSFGHAGFVCIGAYVSILCTMAFGLPYWLSLIIAGLAAMLLGAGLGKITLNLKGDYFCIATLGEAALRAVRDGRRFATQSDLEESIEVVIAGYQKKNAILTDHEKWIVAYHETGHALVAALQSHSAPVQKITIIPRTSGALGYTMQVEEGNHYLMTREEMENKIATLTGGRAAEEVRFGSVTTGASNDIEQATKLARAMVTRYGMSADFDMVALETVTNQYLGGDASLACSAETQTKIDALVVALVKREHEKAVKLLNDHRSKLDELSKYLYEKETITGEEFMKILNLEKAQDKTQD